MQTLDFAVSSEYSYDAKSGRFRYTSGASKGKFAPRDAVLELTRRSIARQSEDLIALGDRLSNGSLSLKDFQRQSAELLRQIHVSSAVLGRGGSDRMTGEDWLKVARTLKVQYTDGKDPETGRRFGLKWLSEEIREGKVTAGQLRSRLRLYANSGNLTYWDMWRRSEVDGDRPYAVRELGQAEHCDDCPKLAAQKPQSILGILLPGQGCECGTNCKCRLRALTLEEAIARGLKDPRPAAQRKRELDAIERLGFGRRRRSSNFEEEFDYRQYVRDGQGRFAKVGSARGSVSKAVKQQAGDRAEVEVAAKSILRSAKQRISDRINELKQSPDSQGVRQKVEDEIEAIEKKASDVIDRKIPELAKASDDRLEEIRQDLENLYDDSIDQYRWHTSSERQKREVIARKQFLQQNIESLRSQAKERSQALDLIKQRLERQEVEQSALLDDFKRLDERLAQNRTAARGQRLSASQQNEIIRQMQEIDSQLVQIENQITQDQGQQRQLERDRRSFQQQISTAARESALIYTGET